jgi:hypothetical protein
MGWLDVIGTAIDVANLAVSVSNASKVNELRQQGAAAHLIDSILSAMRDDVYHYKQACENILSREVLSPIKAAGAMRALEIKVAESGLLPELFGNYSDREYAEATFRTIREHSRRLSQGLSGSDKSLVEAFAKAVVEIEEVKEYVDSFLDGVAVLNAKTTYDKLKSRNESCMLMIGVVIAGLFSWGLLAIPVVIYMRPWEYRSAKKIIEEKGSRVNLSLFERMHRMFGGSESARMRLNELNRTVGEFLNLPDIPANVIDQRPFLQNGHPVTYIEEPGSYVLPLPVIVKVNGGSVKILPCPVCGRQVTNRARICGNCGSTFDELENSHPRLDEFVLHQPEVIEKRSPPAPVTLYMTDAALEQKPHFCPFCGKNHPLTARICPYCGKRNPRYIESDGR